MKDNEKIIKRKYKDFKDMMKDNELTTAIHYVQWKDDKKTVKRKYKDL